MNKLTFHDLQFALLRAPKALLQVMKKPEWANKVFVGGGYLRAIVAGEPVNDIDVFVTCKDDADRLALALLMAQEKVEFTVCGKAADFAKSVKQRIYTTDNAVTLPGFKTTIQIIHRWTFTHPWEVINSFDFSICGAVFWWAGEAAEAGTMAGWQSLVLDRFYADLASKRLVYQAPARIEDAGGSLLRVLKYYAKGYRIPIDSMGSVMARMVCGVEPKKVMGIDGKGWDEVQLAKVLTGLLREVDPNIDPSHVAHLPAEGGSQEEARKAAIENAGGEL